MPLILNGSTGISGTDGSAGTPAVQGTDTNTGMFFPAADQIAFAEGGVEAMRLDASGNVGIGTTTPGGRLDVAGFTRLGNYGGMFQGLTLQNNNDSASAETISFIDAQNNLGIADANIFFSHQTNGGSYIAFSTTPAGSRSSDRRAERARITSDGNFLVGTTSTFDVSSGATTQLSGQCAVFAVGSPNTIMSFYNSTQSPRVGFIGSNGNSTSYNSGSDYRLKENVTNISGAAAAVQSLRPVTFTWKVSPETGTFSGFIAHELQGVWPEAVVGEKDAICDDGVTPNYQMVDQSKLVPLLTAALQEALTEIASLKARVAALEATP